MLLTPAQLSLSLSVFQVSQSVSQTGCACVWMGFFLLLIFMAICVCICVWTEEGAFGVISDGREIIYADEKLFTPTCYDMK